MGENELAARMVALLHQSHGESSRQGKALVDWANDWRWHYAPDQGRSIAWNGLPAFAALVAEGRGEPDAVLEAIADVLDFDDVNRAVFVAGVTLNRSVALAALRRALENLGVDILSLLGTLAGGASGAAVRSSLPFTLGLFEANAGGGTAPSLEIGWTLERLLGRGDADPGRLGEALIGARQSDALPLAAFDGLPEIDLLVRLIKGALRGESGINILLHGPPGTGKTELARSIAAAAGATLFAVGESDQDGDEPNRFDRLAALRRAQRVLERRAGSALLFDEMEDLIDDTRRGGHGYDDARMGSKIFLNRMLERNPAPVIWTSNAIAMIDDAHLRRMSFVLKLDHPIAGRRGAILQRMAEAEAMDCALDALASIAREEPGLPAVARVALRTARIAGGAAEDTAMVANAVLQGLRGGEPRPPSATGAALDLDLFESDPPVADLVARLTAHGAASNFSMLLTGAPGTGKTALAAHVAGALDRPLHVKRASDLLSKWVGESERNIARAFADARRDGSVLLFDEVDSLLFDRADATRSWEVTQVNELLTWMDGHALPFIAATNHPGRLDPAALRRFTFKLRLEPLSRERAAAAFERFFEVPAPDALGDVTTLTPGDFALVKRQLRFRATITAAEIVALLDAESRVKPGARARIGF